MVSIEEQERTAVVEAHGPQNVRRPRVLGFATQGAGNDDEARMRALASFAELDVFSFDKRNKLSSFRELLKKARRDRPDVILMEGTGVAGGAAVLLARYLFRVPYVVSSGDAVGPFLTALVPAGKLLFEIYERLLCRFCSGFIGWTPYLAGRALTFGAPRAVSVPGWAPYHYSAADLAFHRDRIRRQLGIPRDAVVFGIAGSLTWTPRKQYCYGYELVRAWKQCHAASVHVLIVGDGSGVERLRHLAGNDLGNFIHMTGRVPREDVPKYLAAMDIGSLPQSVDGVGSFRFTTKISEYFAAKLPFIATQIPAAYDLDAGGIYRLGGKTPWDPAFISNLARFMQTVTPQWVSEARASIPESVPEFDRQKQLKRFRAFLCELVAQ